MTTSKLAFNVFVDIKESNKGEWKKVMCVSDCSLKFYDENGTTVSDSCGSTTFVDRVVDFSFKIGKVLNKTSLEEILGTPTTEITSGVKAISYTGKVKLDKILVIPEKSNDGAGVTNLVITKDGVDLVLGTDYSVAVVNEETIITFITPNSGDEVVITGDVNVNGGRSIAPKLGQYVKNKVDVRFTAVEEIEGTNYNFLIQAKEGTNSSEYVLKFLNEINGGAPEGIEQVIKFDKGTVDMIDEITLKLETMEIQ